MVCAIFYKHNRNELPGRLTQSGEIKFGGFCVHTLTHFALASFKIPKGSAGFFPVKKNTTTNSFKKNSFKKIENIAISARDEG